MAQERWHLEALDALRGFAILGVVMVHSSYWGPDRQLLTSSHLVNDFIYSGQRGVQLFFLVSAFALYLSYDSRKKERHPLRNFFLRRLFRLTPMFYVATFLGLLLWRSAMGSVPHIVLSMLYLNNFSPSTITAGAPGSWSISTEAAFYLFLPIGFRYVRTARSAALVCFAGAVVRHLTFGSANSDYWEYMSIFANLSVFAMGVLLYLLWRDHLRNMTGTAEARTWSAGVLVVAAALFLEMPTRSPNLLLYGSALAFLLATSLLLHPWKLLVNRYTVFLGQISFSLYLLHFFVMRGLEHLVLRYERTHGVQGNEPLLLVGMFVGALAIGSAFAALTWRWIEQPCMRLGKRLIERLESKKVPGLFAEEQF